MKCCQYTAGMLREPVTFQRKSRVRNGTGGFDETLATIPGAPTRASVKALSGGERWASDRVEATTRWRLVTRYFDGLTEEDIALVRGRKHNIRFINNVELRDRWLEIEVDGGVAT
jgi:head-tail adaptor